MSRALDTYMAMKFLKLLTTPFEEWEAFKLGLIDEDGKVVRKAKGGDEKKEMTAFHNLARNMKKLLMKFPGGRSFTGSLIIGLALLRENCNAFGQDGDRIIEIVAKELEDVGFKINHLEESKRNYRKLREGRFAVESPFSDRELVYIRETVFPHYLTSPPIYRVTDVRGNEHLVTQEHLKDV